MPIVAADAAATQLRATATVKLIVGGAVGHGIIKTDFFTGGDRPHGEEGDVAAHPGVGLAGMVDHVRRFVRAYGHTVNVIFNLKAMLSGVRGKGRKLVSSKGITAPNGNQFPFCEWLRGVKAIPPFFWMLAQPV